MAVKLTVASRNAMLDAFTALIDSAGPGHIRLMTGAVPSSAGTSEGTEVAFLVFPADSFPAASSGAATQTTITPDTDVDGGTAEHFEITNAAENAIYAQGTVGTSGADINFSPTNVMVATGTASISTMTITVPETCA